MSYIFTKEIVENGNERKFGVRVFGMNTHLNEAEFVKAVKDNQVFFKANKPFTERHLRDYSL